MADSGPQQGAKAFHNDVANAMEIANACFLKEKREESDPSHIIDPARIDRWWEVFLWEWGKTCLHRHINIFYRLNPDPNVLSRDPSKFINEWENALEPIWEYGCKIAKESSCFQPFRSLQGQVRAGTGRWAELDQNQRKQFIEYLEKFAHTLDKVTDKYIELYRPILREVVTVVARGGKKFAEADMVERLRLLWEAGIHRARE